MPVRMRAGRNLRDRGYARRLREEVRGAGRTRGEPRPLVDQPERVRVTRPRAARVVVREKLRLQRRHVDVDGALVSAPLAREAEVERVEHLLRLPERQLVAL